jgi:hypothetical protein
VNAGDDVMDHETYREWLDLEADGALDPERGAELAAHLESCAECREQRRLSAALVARLAADRVPVREGFARDVLAAVGNAPWERASGRRSWRLPVALLVLVGAAAAWFARAAATGAAADSGWPTLAALAGMVRSALVSGAGLAAATWGGVGAVVGGWLGASPARWIVAAVGVLCLDLLAVRLLRRRVRAAARRGSPPRG